MNIATRIFFIFLVILSLLSAIVISMSFLADSRKQMLIAETQLHLSYKLASQLRQTSDDLTRMARTYVTTGDAIYEKYFYEILDIRDGKLPRPENYEDSYWDFVTAKENDKSLSGDAVSLLDLMKQAGIDGQELTILRKAKEHSDYLATVEKIAFGAMKGLFADEQGKLTVHRTPDPDFAHEILHNAQYHAVKAEIMRPIREFNAHINERIFLKIEENKIKENYYWKVTFLLIGATIIFSLMAFFYFRIKVVNPIISLSNISKRILSGELSQRAVVDRGDEIGNLNKAFNRMLEARIKVEFELKNNEQNLRTTLNSIGDALIATDVYGNITRMNPVAEELSGWQISEAEGKPLSKVFNIINAITREKTTDPVHTVLGSGNTVGLANHTILIAKDGTEHQIADSAAPIRDDDGDITGVVLVFRDITEEYAIQQSLYESEERFKGLFENAEVAMCNEDLSEIVTELKRLRRKGVTNLRQYLETDLEVAWAMTKMVKVNQVNRAMLELFGSSKLKGFFGSVRNTFGPGAINVFIDELCAIWDKKPTFRSEVNFITPSGKNIDVIISFQIPKREEDFKSIPFSIMNITDLKETETELRQSERRFKRLFENAEVPVCNENLSEIKIELEKLRNDGVTDIRQYLKNNDQAIWQFVGMVKVIQVNKATLKMFGATSDTSFIDQFDKTFGPNAIDVFIDGLCAIWDKKKVFRAVTDFRNLNGEIINAIISYPIPVREEDFRSIPVIIMNITDLKNKETELKLSEERFKRLFENAEVAMCNEDLSRVVKELDKLRLNGVTDLRKYLKNDLETAWNLVDKVNITHVNNAMLSLFDSKKDTYFSVPVRDTFGPGAINVFIDELCAIWDKEPIFRSEIKFITLTGEIIDVILSFQIPKKKEDFKSIPISKINITELKKTETELRHSEGRFKRLFENAEVSIWNEDLSEVLAALKKLRKDGVTDLRQYLEENEQATWDMTALVKVVQVNKATVDLFRAETGYKFIKEIDNTFGENAIKVFTDELCAIWDKKKVFRSEADFLSSDGKTINAIITFQIPEKDEDFKNVPVSIIDITELKMAETARRESEERLSLHQERSPLGVISWDNNMTCIQWNPAAEEIFGYTQEEALGKHGVELLVSKKLSSETSELTKKLMQQTGGTHSISENITKDGRTIVCEWFNTPLIDENGHSIGAASMVQDITKHKLIENELRKLSSAVQQSPASIIITDTNGAIEYVNPKFEESTGYSSTEIMGKNPRFLKSGYTTKEEYESLWDTITSGKEWQGEFHNRRKDGSLYWEAAFISPITDEDGTITHFLAAKQDITERKQLEDHLRRSHKMEAVGELAGGIAHDFNNLLGVIIGNLDLMKRRVEEGSKLQNQLEKAQKAALRGSSLTRRLLNFSHQAPEAGSPADVNKVIRSLEELVAKSLTSKITLETVLTDDLWMVELNTGDFEDMLINFSLNARDAMPKGGRLIVETQNKVINQSIADHEENLKPGEYVEIAISDTGSGIPKNIITKIFDPFYTTKDKDKGTGLGLAMVYGFIQRTKGHISVYSEEGIGTTFRIYLPRSMSMAERMKHPVKVDEVLKRGTESILIVDDEEELTFIAKNILEELGYTTKCVYNSEEALHVLKENNIDLLFSDIVMAGSLNGFDLADAAAKTYPDLKILLTSGFAGKMQDSKEMEKWGKKMIIKPYRGVELANRIRHTLDEKD